MSRVLRAGVVAGVVVLSVLGAPGSASARSCQGDAVALDFAKFLKVEIGRYNSGMAKEGGLHFGPDGSSWVKACREA